MPRLNSETATDRPETTRTKLPSIPEVVWQPPPQTNLLNIHNDLNIETHKNTYTPELKEKTVVKSQTLQIKETSPQ